jgi:hypothetical protein
MQLAEEVIKLADLDDAELYALLGEELFGESREISPGALDRLGERGRRWFDNWYQQTREAICSHPAVIALQDAEEATRLQEAAALVDALLALRTAPPVATASAILLRHGVQQICGS